MSILILAGFILVAVILPLGILIGFWFVMGFRLGLFMLLFFVPVLTRLVMAPSGECISSGIIQVILLFAAVLIAVGIVLLLERYTSATGAYIWHFHTVWPDYDDLLSVRMFFWVTVFALGNQLIEFIHAVLGLLGKQ